MRKDFLFKHMYFKDLTYLQIIYLSKYGIISF